jgi:hypothetical protein
MNQINKKNSFEEILKDKQHKDRAKEVFLKLLAKQKRPANPFGVVRSETYPIKDTKLGADTNDVF